MLPILPAAAEIPWQMQRYEVGKISAGIMKVKVFAPMACEDVYKVKGVM